MRPRPSLAVATFLFLTSACAGRAHVDAHALPHACAIVSNVDASRLFGGDAKIYGTQSGRASVCKWEQRKDGNVQGLAVVEFDGREYYMPQPGDERLRGIADAAYLSVEPDGSRIVFGARKGDHVVEITFVETHAVKGGADTADVSDRANDVLALGKIAANRL